jgi:hypothetical protein
MRSSTVTPQSSAHRVKYFSTRARGNRSIPAGTGVWVVNRCAGLVHVEDLRLQAEGLESADASHPEDDLLPDALLLPATVEPVGDEPVLVRVVLDVGVEQEQRDPADRRPPQGDVDVDAADVDLHPYALDRLERHLVRVEAGEPLLLPAAVVERLAEVAVVVEQPDPDQGHPQVAGRLEVVPCEDAQAPGVLGEAVRDPELRAEVGTEVERAGVDPLEPPGGVEGPSQVVEHLLDGGDVLVVGCRHGELVARHRRQEPEDVGAVVVVPVGVEPSEQVLDPLVGHPPEVRAEDAERFQRGRERGRDGEGVNGFHGRDATGGVSGSDGPAVRWISAWVGEGWVWAG